MIGCTRGIVRAQQGSDLSAGEPGREARFRYRAKSFPVPSNTQARYDMGFHPERLERFLSRLPIAEGEGGYDVVPRNPGQGCRSFPQGHVERKKKLIGEEHHGGKAKAPRSR